MSIQKKNIWKITKTKKNRFIRSQLLNFNCIFPDCNYKNNDIKEEEFLKHLKGKHQNEMLDMSKKENIPITMVEIITISNSRVFINS